MKCLIVASHHVACDIYVHDIFENFESNVDLLLVSLQSVWPQEQKSLKLIMFSVKIEYQVVVILPSWAQLYLD